MSTISKQLLSTIKTVVDERIKSAGFNRTRTGKILSVGQNNTYSILIDGRQYNNIPCYGGGVFNIGDITKVYIPNNQNNQMYILNYQTTIETINYNDLANIPSINSVPLKGNQSFEDLGFSLQDYWDEIYPVGCIFLSAINTNPSTYFGGTWIEINDVFLFAKGDNAGNLLNLYTWQRTE